MDLEQPVPETAAETPAPPPVPHPHKSRVVPLVLGGIAFLILGVGWGLFEHARSGVNKVALDESPKLVTITPARAAEYRPTLRYVGTIEPWVSAKVGPQFVSAYVDTVLVRPGSVVKRGQVIATLDCRNASSLNKAIAGQARAIAASQAAIAREASRVSSLVDGGYASPNEAEMKTAESLKEQAQLQSLQAQQTGSQLQVSDCILRAPFNGEVAERLMDPGAFVHPGEAIATIVDRSILRVTADVPEADFAEVAPGTKIRTTVLATGGIVEAAISRRAPSADPATRTVHFEADVNDSTRTIPTGTTAEILLEAGTAKKVTRIPLTAAAVKQEHARVFIVEDGIAHARSFPVVGERGGDLFVDPALPDGAEVVTQGRLQLEDGDKVTAHGETTAQATP
jgi:RND family efflux transporter MFP subunit